MSTLRELLIARHQHMSPKLDALRRQMVVNFSSKNPTQPLPVPPPGLALARERLGWDRIGSHLKSGRLLVFGGLLTLLLILFCRPLWDLAAFASGNNLYSHIFLIPAVSAYLLWLAKDRLRGDFQASAPAAVLFGALGAVILVGYFDSLRRGIVLAEADYLAAMGFAFLCLLLSAVALCFGLRVLREGGFAFGFLIFAFPPPARLMHGLTIFLQHASADLGYAFISWTGTPIYREGLLFFMPDLVVEVADECSGIRSTFVLLITSLIAGYLFLQRPWRRAVFAFAIIPLGIARNAFRILTICWLTVHVDPGIIQGPLHRRGGPLFFAMSLIPLFALLVWLRRSERRLIRAGENRLQAPNPKLETPENLQP
jgi:exosortase C (VPDSG-CTERM-specific)